VSGVRWSPASRCWWASDPGGGSLSATAGFEDRRAGGRALAEELLGFGGRDDVVVLGLPRGGVPVAAEVARVLHVPLNVFMVRKLGVPGREELALGAIASGGVRVLNEDVVAAAGISSTALEAVVRRELEELERRERTYLGDAPPLDPRGRVAIVVDDGLATGATMRAAALALAQRGAGAIVVAVPVAPVQACRMLRRYAGEVVCTLMPEPFIAVGQWYQDFSPVSDQEVRRLLDRTEH
jgi:predicted phosphoribosyltransferase